jgi:hypothetical protein
VHQPALTTTLLAQAADFAATWLAHFPAVLQPGLIQRTAALLPCLMLARIDGKSPVEYLSEANRQLVRDLAMPAIARPPASIAELLEGLGVALAARGERR